jgi:hypothetical protein
LAFFFFFVTPALPLSFQGAAGGRGVVGCKHGGRAGEDPRRVEWSGVS